MSNQETEVKVGMWIQIPKLTKKQEKTLLDIKSNKKYEIVKIIGGENIEVVIEDEIGDEHHIPLNQNEWLFGKSLILLDENQQPLTKSTKKEIVKESKPQITAQEMYIKELEKTAKSLREQRKVDENTITELSKVVQQFEKSVQTLETSNLRLQEILESSKNDVEHLENKLDESYKEQEQMMIDFKEGLKCVKYNLIQILIATNSIKVQDIRTFTDICLRSLERDYKYQSKED